MLDWWWWREVTRFISNWRGATWWEGGSTPLSRGFWYSSCRYYPRRDLQIKWGGYKKKKIIKPCWCIFISVECSLCSNCSWMCCIWVALLRLYRIMNHPPLLAAVHLACYIEQWRPLAKRTIDRHNFACHLLLHIRQTSDAQSVYMHEIQVICDLCDQHIFFCCCLLWYNGVVTGNSCAWLHLILLLWFIIIVCSEIKRSVFL